MKTKQGSYIVECENREQTIIVLDYVEQENHEGFGRWKFVCYIDKEYDELDIFQNLEDAKIFFPNAELISFEDWENLPNEESKSMPHINIGTISRLPKEKELIGWKLEKEEYREVAGLIAYKVYGDNRFTNCESGCHFQKGSLAEERLKEAGVLELWFTPVYKEEEQKTLKLSFGELTQDDIEQLKQSLK